MKKVESIRSLLIVAVTTAVAMLHAQPRTTFNVNAGWKTAMSETDSMAFNGFETVRFDDSSWSNVTVPHNWDRYDGFRRLKHGNLHGTAWYRKWFSANYKKGKRYFLYFEGVGSYATVFVNGQKVGTHAGGRTTFTLDVTQAIHANGKPNLLAVRTDHPANIRDLPWVCGGCSNEWGFSEGSQPMGIFRPVQLVVTNNVRIEPFGVHVWNDTTVTESSSTIFTTTELKNYGQEHKTIRIVTKVIDKNGKPKGTSTTSIALLPNHQPTEIAQNICLDNVELWSPANPALYTVVSQLYDGNTLIDQTDTPYGIRWIQWPIGKQGHTGQFFINGKPFFINGTAEYEHQLGMSHAFTDEQIHSRAMQVKAAGYNAFRDAHQPHNLRYQKYWDEGGILWWPQMAAHIWFDTPAFRHNFKSLLAQFVKERRNSPSIVLWGLENESTLPTDFAQECVNIIREMDPTARNQRLVTTCNGGTGTDWNVVQNWSGTYSGDPHNYANEIATQLLNGEYGAWRSIDFHTEGDFVQNGPLSEDRMTLLMELKIREAEKARQNSCGQFHWLFNSHENPGRIQNGEGLRDIDRIGPVNYKGLFTLWGEPTDAFYIFRANYASKISDPMAYIVSHTWPNRYTQAGEKSGLIVYSNCDEVELFNDMDGLSLGKKRNGGVGTHFQWDSVQVAYNVLRAVGYVNGKAVANDLIVLQNMPQSPHFNKLTQTPQQANSKAKALYRVNCGGPDYTDTHGNHWMADRHWTDSTTWGSLSWTDDFEDLPHSFASQRRVFDPIGGTADWKLHQTFRYGTDRLRFRFPVKGGKYTIQLHFVEPWYGTGGGMDCKGWRLFDVAVNGKTYLSDLDIWNEAGHDHALVKTITTHIKGNLLELSFPRTKAGQAIVSAIAIYADNRQELPASPSPLTIGNLSADNGAVASVESWLDWGDETNYNCTNTFVTLPPALFGADWIKTGLANGLSTPFSFSLSTRSNLYVALHPDVISIPAWMDGFTDTQTTLTTSNELSYKVFTKQLDKGRTITVPSAPIPHQQAPWLVMAQASFNLPQASDQRPVFVYEPDKGMLIGQGETGTYRDRAYAKIGTGHFQSVTWTITPGVADVYNLNFRYFQETTQPIKGQIVLKTSDGIVLMEQQIDFQPKKDDGTWRSIRTNTLNTINAGKYLITLTLIDQSSAPISIGALEVQ